MASGGQKKKDQEAQNWWDAQARQSFQTAAAPTPLQTTFEKQQQDYLNWENAPGHNIADAPGLSNYIQIGQAAQNRANEQRMGSGAYALADGSGSGYAQQLHELGNAQRAEDFGTGLENARAMRHAEAVGSVLPLASLNLNRAQGQTSAAGSMYGTLLNRPKRQPFWQQLLQGAVGAAGAFA